MSKPTQEGWKRYTWPVGHRFSPERERAPWENVFVIRSESHGGELTFSAVTCFGEEDEFLVSETNDDDWSEVPPLEEAELDKAAVIDPSEWDGEHVGARLEEMSLLRGVNR
jgi:hypothetical protein